VYRIAGGEIPSPAAFAEQPLAVRVTFMQLFQELLEMKVKLHQARPVPRSLQSYNASAAAKHRAIREAGEGLGPGAVA
jgi:hypothetical protein